MSGPSRWREAWRSFLALPLVWNLLLGRAPRRMRLPIGFLPGEVGVLRRRKPALLLLGDERTRERCLRVLLEAELPQAPVCWLGPDEQQVRALGPVVHAAAQRGRLHAMAWTDDASAQLRQRGDAYLMRELADCGLRRRELLIVDVLTPWLAKLTPGADPAPAVQQAAAALERWAELHPDAPVLGLAPVQHGTQALLPLWERSGIPALAQLQRHGEQVHLEVVRWPQSTGGTVQDLGFGLVERDDGGWQADGAGVALQTHELVKAGDLHAVYTLPAALVGSDGYPAGWKVFDGMAELALACRYAVAATVLLPCTQRDELPLLVEAVRSLRRAHPHALKIAVREVGVSLRYNQELALKRAGANGVLYRADDFAQVQEALLAMRHQTFDRRLAGEDGDELLNDVAPDPVRGYLAPAAFCDAVEGMVKRTTPLGLSHCIVQLPLLPEVAHLDALAACHIGRDGDLVTADAQALWLFLFACRAPDVETTLKRLFSLPPSALFNQMRVRPEPDSIQRAIDRLRRGAVDAVTDYGEALKAIQPARLEVSESGFVALQPEGQDTMPATLDEAPQPAPTPRSPARVHLKLRP